MTKVHGKRYAYKFDFTGIAQAIQPGLEAPTPYRFQQDLVFSPYTRGSPIGLVRTSNQLSSSGAPTFPRVSESYWNPSNYTFCETPSFSYPGSGPQENGLRPCFAWQLSFCDEVNFSLFIVSFSDDLSKCWDKHNYKYVCLLLSELRESFISILRNGIAWRRPPVQMRVFFNCDFFNFLIHDETRRSDFNNFETEMEG